MEDLFQLGRPQPSFEIRARIDLLTDAVRVAPSLAGIPQLEALKLIREKLNQRIGLAGLAHMLRTWWPYHELVLREGRVRFHSGVVAEILAARHRSQLLQEPLAQEISQAQARSERLQKELEKEAEHALPPAQTAMELLERRVG